VINLDLVMLGAKATPAFVAQSEPGGHGGTDRARSARVTQPLGALAHPLAVGAEALTRS